MTDNELSPDEAADRVVSMLDRTRNYWERTETSIHTKADVDGERHHFEVCLFSGNIFLQVQRDGEWVDLYTRK